MCGHISIYYKNKEADGVIIRQLTKKIIHRGPDDTGYFIKDNIAFGFNRLSIIDLEGGNQPFKKENKTIIFNGEIYNHKELRKELLKNNKFTTNSTATNNSAKKLKKPKISKLKKKKNTVSIYWDKINTAKGYEISYSTSKKFKKNSTKTIKVKRNKKNATIKKLKKGKKYYIRIRAYKTLNGKKIYSSYSKVKSVKL